MLGFFKRPNDENLLYYWQSYITMYYGWDPTMVGQEKDLDLETTEHNLISTTDSGKLLLPYFCTGLRSNDICSNNTVKIYLTTFPVAQFF